MDDDEGDDAFTSSAGILRGGLRGGGQLSLGSDMILITMVETH